MSRTPNQVCVVTGAGRGMGRAIARALARQGHTVVAVARTRADLMETAASPAGSGRLVAHPADVAEPDAIEEVFREVLRTYGRIDVLVCSHGAYQGGISAFDLSLDQFDATIRVNLRACLHCAQLAGRAMRDVAGGGRIVFISSMNGDAAQIGAVDYDTSKAALNGLTRALAVDYARFGITVNAIAPGWVRTPMSEHELLELDRRGMVVNPLHRVGEPEDIAHAVLWLTDPGNSYTTGAVIRVDGGQLAMLPMPWTLAGEGDGGRPSA